MDGPPLPRHERLALWASAAAIVLVVAAQAPGRIIPETKLDVTLDPVGYLARAFSAWDPSGGFGRVQNQAIGYLFPMGAFSAAGHGAGLPPWLVQRLWIGAVLAAGLWGAHRVARAVGVSTVAGRLVAAWAYALSPATLGVAAFQSAGQLPYAMVPHVLVPLLTARDGDSPRRVAARSTLWIAAMGGVNGASSFAVLPLVAIWLLTRSPGAARRRLLAWWAGGAVLATLWWLIPLLVSVRYGIRFTDFTESASLTTITESSTEVLRGTGNWLAYLTNQSGPWLPGGLAMATSRLAVVGSVAVAGGGLWGLSRPKAPGRAWLVPALALGTAAMGIGYVGAWGGPFADASHALLDGPFAPFRNVHKFAAVVRLPLAIGLGHAATVAAARFAARRAGATSGSAVGTASGAAGRRRPAAATALAAVATLAVVLSVLPAATELTAPGSFADVPDSWRAAAAWLHQHDDGGRALLVPGSSFGEYRWGRPLDEPLSSLDAGDWAVRDLIPLGGNGSTRLLDGIDDALQGDHLPVGFVSALQRSGVSYLVVRNDLDIVRTEAPRPATVRRLLQTAPSLHLVVSFGDLVTDPGSDNRLSYPPGASSSEAYREIEVYRVPAPGGSAAAGSGPGRVVASYPQAGAAVVSGGPEALLDLDLSPAQAAVLAVDPGARAITEPTRVVTDTARNRDVEFGAIRDNASYTLAAHQLSPTTRTDPVDRWPAGRPVGLTVARLQGAATLTASGRRGELLRPERQPFAAFDGNPTTAWAPSKEEPKGWIEVGWDRAVPVGRITIRQPDTTGRRVRTIRVTTDHGSRTARFGADGRASVAPPRGPTRHLRIAIESLAAGADLEPAGFSQIDIDGVTIARPLVAPEVQGAGGDEVVLSRSHSDAFSFYRRDEDGLLDRRFSWAGTDAPVVSGTAAPQPGPALDQLLAEVAGDADPTALTATASSRFRDQPALSAAAAADGDPTTAWVSAAQATAPSLTLAWTDAVPVDALQITTVDAGVDPVGRVEVRIGGRTYLRTLTSSGQVAIPATTADRVTLSFPGDARAAGHSRQVAIAEVAIPALLGRTAPAPDRSKAVVLACGHGPDLQIDGRTVSTSARTTVGDLLDAAPVRWRACGTVRLAHGWHRLTSDGGPLLASTVRLAPADPAPPGPARVARPGRWDDERRTIRVGAGPASIVATGENLNDGWQATLDGRRLTPIRVDGWRQGWLVPAGRSATIELHYGPGATQRTGISLGLAGVAALLALAVIRPRRAAAWTPPDERPWSTTVMVGVGAVVSLCLAGLPVLAVAAALLLRPVRRRLPWVALAAIGAAGAVTFVQAGAEIGSATGTFSGPAQVLSAVAVLAVVATGLDRPAATPAAGSTPSSPDPSDHLQPGTSTTPEGSG